jgi:lysophospholipase L1-like esterase
MRTPTSILLLFGLSVILACDNTPVGPGEPSVDSVSREHQTREAAQQTTNDFPFKKILCFGDSLTYGTTSRIVGGLPALTMVEGYVPKLQRRLVEEYGDGFNLINSGIGGETSTEAVDRIGGEIRQVNPDLVLLLHGIVDVNNPLPRFPVVRANLNEMMRIVIRHNIPIIIATYPPLNPEGFRIQGIDNIARLNDVIRQEAKQYDVPVADHWNEWGGNISGQGPDGLHPNDGGYERMAETWLAEIQELAEKLST